MLLVLVLTHQCDLACTYCYAGPKDGRVMPLAIGRRAIDRALLAVPRGGTLRLGLFGGEPLLAWRATGRPLVAYAAEGAARRGVRIAPTVTTNGTRLDARTLDELRALEVEVAVSMDGLPEVHDAGRPGRAGRPSSGAALAAIDLLVGRGLPFRVVSVVRPESCDRVVEGTRFLADRGVRAVVHALDYGAPWAPADGPRLRAVVRGLRELWVTRFPDLELSWLEGKAAQLLEGLEQPACGVSAGEIAVAPSGRLYPCERLVGDDAPGPFWSGHVDDGDGPLELARARSAQPGADAPCATCAAEPFCANACACANLARTGALDGPDGLICTLEQARLEEARAGLAALADRSGPARRLPVAGLPG